MRRPLLIAGPTASGKSSLALRVAERDRGCVINADASQVYACWRVLTARPDDGDLAQAPHLLYGHVPCERRHSVGDWLRDVTGALEACASRGTRPIFVGGTGLYFHGLTRGVAAIPAIPANVRDAADARLRSGGPDALRSDLARDDPTTFARLDPANPVRLQRAWEVLRATGRGLASWQDDPTEPILADGSFDALVVLPSRDRVASAIGRRFHDMIDAGALRECRDFARRGLSPTLPASRVHGAQDLLAYLSGEQPLDTAIERSVTATRQYAKRQRTWIRNRMGDWPAYDPDAVDILEMVPAG